MHLVQSLALTVLHRARSDVLDRRLVSADEHDVRHEHRRREHREQPRSAVRAPLSDKNDLRAGEGRQLAQDNHDDVFRVDGCVRARGSTRIEPDERGERPEAVEHGPYHEHEEKLAAPQARVSQLILTDENNEAAWRNSPFDFVRQHTAQSLHTAKPSVPRSTNHTKIPGMKKEGCAHKDSDDHTSKRTTAQTPPSSDPHHPLMKQKKRGRTVPHALQ